MTHVPGNAFTRRDPNVLSTGFIEAWEVCEHLGDPLDAPTVIARAQVARDGTVWVTGGSMTAGQANVFGQLVEGLAHEAAESYRVDRADLTRPDGAINNDQEEPVRRRLPGGEEPGALAPCPSCGGRVSHAIGCDVPDVPR